jgi:hypothetical protein
LVVRKGKQTVTSDRERTGIGNTVTDLIIYISNQTVHKLRLMLSW